DQRETEVRIGIYLVDQSYLPLQVIVHRLLPVLRLKRRNPHIVECDLTLEKPIRIRLTGFGGKAPTLPRLKPPIQDRDLLQSFSRKLGCRQVCAGTVLGNDEDEAIRGETLNAIDEARARYVN